MPAEDATGGPKQLNSAKLILQARALREESRELIRTSNLLVNDTWDALARILMQYLEPRSR